MADDDRAPRLMGCLLFGDDVVGYTFFCPGCEITHHFTIKDAGQDPGHVWTFDGNFESPTFQPSLDYVGHCHLRLVSGRLQFQGDSNHALAGQTVDMVPFPERGFQSLQ